MSFAYSFDPTVRYNPMDELHLNPKSRKGITLITKSLNTSYIPCDLKLTNLN